MLMAITLVLLTVFCFFLIGEIIYHRRLYNYMIDKYDGLVERSTELADVSKELHDAHVKTLDEYVQFSALTEQLLKSETKEEAEKIADKIYILVQTGVSRGNG